MKYLQFFTLVLLISLTACQGQNKGKVVAAEVDPSVTKIEVIDFYGTHRCVTCEAIEANAKYTVDTYYPSEQQKGLVEFKTVNVDDRNNYDMAERYEAAGTALFINVVNGGVETHIDLTDFAFSKGRDRDLFSNELKAKIDAELAKL